MESAIQKKAVRLFKLEKKNREVGIVLLQRHLLDTFIRLANKSAI
jgi:hypothetical protein